MVRIIVFGGTTEGRELSCRLAELGAAVTVCVATDYGREEQGERDGVTVLTGRKTEPEMEGLLSGAALCVDATHPYAVEVSRNVRTACAAVDVPYRRLLREAAGAKLPGKTVVVDNAAAAVGYLRSTTGNILLTTGAKEVGVYAAAGAERIYPRILPSHAGLDECEKAGIPHRNIVAMQGPFSAELNAALIRQFQIAYVVTKDGGAAGGFPEKARAAADCGAVLVVLRRPEDTGERFETVLSDCEALIQAEQ